MTEKKKGELELEDVLAGEPMEELMDEPEGADGLLAGGEELPEEEARPDILDVAADIPVQVVAVMGKKTITMKELALLKMGEVIELSRPANEVVDLVAGGRLIAKGELVEIDGKLGVRIVKMVR